MNGLIINFPASMGWRGFGWVAQMDRAACAKGKMQVQFLPQPHEQTQNKEQLN